LDLTKNPQVTAQLENDKWQSQEACRDYLMFSTSVNGLPCLWNWTTKFRKSRFLQLFYTSCRSFSYSFCSLPFFLKVTCYLFIVLL